MDDLLGLNDPIVEEKPEDTSDDPFQVCTVFWRCLKRCRLGSLSQPVCVLCMLGSFVVAVVQVSPGSKQAEADSAVPPPELPSGVTLEAPLTQQQVSFGAQNGFHSAPNPYNPPQPQQAYQMPQQAQQAYQMPQQPQQAYQMPQQPQQGYQMPQQPQQGYQMSQQPQQGYHVPQTANPFGQTGAELCTRQACRLLSFSSISPVLLEQDGSCCALTRHGSCGRRVSGPGCQRERDVQPEPPRQQWAGIRSRLPTAAQFSAICCTSATAAAAATSICCIRKERIWVSDCLCAKF